MAQLNLGNRIGIALYLLVAVLSALHLYRGLGKKNIILIILLVQQPIISESKTIQFFNADVLGKHVSESIISLEYIKNKDENILIPKAIHLDVENDLYIASTIYYDSKEITYKQLVEEIDNRYPNTRNSRLSSETFSAWRVEDEKFVITVSSTFLSDGFFEVIYVRFRNSTEEELLEQAREILRIIKTNCNE